MIVCKVKHVSILRVFVTLGPNFDFLVENRIAPIFLRVFVTLGPNFDFLVENRAEL